MHADAPSDDRVCDAGVPNRTAIDLRLSGDRVLRIRPGFDARTLGRLIQLLDADFGEWHALKVLLKGVSQRPAPHPFT